jgi:hypothetical protein
MSATILKGNNDEKLSDILCKGQVIELRKSAHTNYGRAG